MERRGSRGIREFAGEIGVSPATLSRVERGKLPDLETFSKICKYLKIDPAEILQIPKQAGKKESAMVEEIGTAVHFKADATLDPDAAKDLAFLILAAQKEMSRFTK